MAKISLSELKKLTHLKINSIELEDRVVPLFAVYKDNQLKQFVNTGNGLVQLEIFDIANGLYFSKQPILNYDLKFYFFNVLYKKANFEEKSKFILYILEDIQNLLASVEKINLFYNIHNEVDNMRLSIYVSTELEYIFKVCRSIYDLLQEIINTIWERFEYIDNSKGKKPFSKICRTSFNSVINYDNQLSTIEELMTRHTIPYELAKFYYRQGEFFSWLRTYRDKISHSGETFHIFVGDEGFSLNIDNNYFSKLHFWNDKNTRNNLGSVKSLVSYIILNTIHGLEDFATTLENIMQLPEDISPKYNLYLRSGFNKTLEELHRYVDEEAWYI